MVFPIVHFFFKNGEPLSQYDDSPYWLGMKLFLQLSLFSFLNLLCTIGADRTSHQEPSRLVPPTFPTNRPLDRLHREAISHAIDFNCTFLTQYPPREGMQRMDCPEVGPFVFTGYLNLASGKAFFKPTGTESSQFAWGHDYFEGFAAVITHDEGAKWGYVDKNGVYALRPQWIEVGDFSHGVAPVVSSFRRITVPCQKHVARLDSQIVEWKWSFIDRKGKTVIPGPFDQLLSFSEGLAGFRRGAAWKPTEWKCRAITGGRWGFLDRRGRVAIAAAFDEATNFSEGLAAVRVGVKWKRSLFDYTAEGGAWGYITPSGDWAIKPRFTFAQPFAEGRATVFIGKEKFLIDRTGAIRESLGK